MGRTLHFKIIKEKSNFTRKELEKINNVCNFYNSEELLNDINQTFKSKLEKLWTCENFWIGLGSYYPDWDNNPTWNVTTGWNEINKRFDELENSKTAVYPYYKQLEILQNEKLIIDAIPKTKVLTGFTKTQGNEFNSMLVLQALIEISKKLPNTTITISDEGEYLICPLTIKKGLALPDIDELKEDMKYYALRMLLSKGFKGNILDKINPSVYDFSYEFKNDIGIENSYGDMTNYIQEKLRNLKEIETVLKKIITNDNELYSYNLSNRNPKNWFKPTLFTRKVDIKKYLDYKCSVATLMDGFHGESFGLSDTDAESESYRAIATIQKLLSGVDSNKKLKILGT